LSPDGHLLFAGEWTSAETARGVLWDVPGGQCLASFPDLDNQYAQGAFSPDGRLLAYPTTNHHLKVWDIAGKWMKAGFRRHTWHLCAVIFSHDGKRLASCGWDGVALIWDVASGELCAPPLEGHRSGINAVFFSADDRTLETIEGGDGENRFWNVANGQEMLTRFRPTINHDTIPAFSLDGRLFIEEETPRRIKFTRLSTLAEIDTAEKAKASAMSSSNW